VSYKILLVDDEPANLRLLNRLFQRRYQVHTAASGPAALDLLSQHDIALLITDQRMPGMTGVELLKRAAALRPQMVRIILTGYADLGTLVEAINCGEIYRYITKPWRNDDLLLTVERALEHYETSRSQYELGLANRRLRERLHRMTSGIARAISEAIEARDEHVYGHGKRVSGYASAIAQRLDLNIQTVEVIKLAGFLHDIGKIGTPDKILLKPGALDDEEMRVLRLHPERGARILSNVPEMEEVVDVIKHHHEHYDGSGYPDGLKQECIPIASRIILVADAYDAMTSPRPFRDSYGHDNAIERLEAGSGIQFDPEIVRTFLSMEELGKIRASVAAGFCGGRLSTSPLNIGDVGFDELVDEVESEPTLAIAVLQAVNRPKSGGDVFSLREACVWLGPTQLQTIVERSAVSPQCVTNPDQLWEHSLRCAIAMKLMAEYTGHLNPSEAYTLGLLHDIGQVLLRTLFPETMEEVLLIGNADAQLEQEIVSFGVDHAQVGQWILDRCGMPGYLSTAVQMHHDAEHACGHAALMLNVANSIADVDCSSEIAAFNDVDTELIARVGLNPGHLARIHEQTSRMLEARYSTAQ
jgi:putative nucleotidyltransferase with HDIG domain